MLDASIYMQLSNAGVTSDSWWSFSDSDGSLRSSYNCNNGTSDSNSVTGTRGSGSYISGSWMVRSNQSCDVSYQLLCIAKP